MRTHRIPEKKIINLWRAATADQRYFIPEGAGLRGIASLLNLNNQYVCKLPSGMHASEEGECGRRRVKAHELQLTLAAGTRTAAFLRPALLPVKLDCR